jgi:hypothetical protein
MKKRMSLQEGGLQLLLLHEARCRHGQAVARPGLDMARPRKNAVIVLRKLPGPDTARSSVSHPLIELGASNRVL